MNEHLSAAIRLIALAMNDENGVSTEVYTGFRDLIGDVVGNAAALRVISGVNATICVRNASRSA